MGYQINKTQMNQIFSDLSDNYIIYAPKRFIKDGTFADCDSIRYAKISRLDEIEFTEKSDYSFKEVVLPISQTLFYFTEKEMKTPDQTSKNFIIFLRSCDLHALKRLDTIYLENGSVDSYYKTLRDHSKFILMGCDHSYENCFCVSMGTNESKDYDAYLKVEGETVLIDSHWPCLDEALFSATKVSVIPDAVSKNDLQVHVPQTISSNIAKSSFWDDYANRCIACGRCNFVCPTCTCFSMEDIFYTDNKKIGERRRVWASCHIDGFTDMAGGHQFRENKGQRMRFKVMHKIKDYKERFGSQMCIGCGRCDDVCPEYISFANSINKLNAVETEDK